MSAPIDDRPTQKVREAAEKWAVAIQHRRLAETAEGWAEFRAAADELDAALAIPECHWTYHDIDCIWESDCGVTYQFSVGGPAENEHNYCHKCRGKLIELLPPHYGDLPTNLEAPDA